MNQSKFFYQNGRITTVTESQKRRSILQGHQVALAEKQTASGETCNFLTTDNKGSIFVVKGQASDETHQYSAYGSACSLPSSASLLGYNGERPERSGFYLLGNERAYSSSLMRFHSADVLSPFGEGGINAYAYCKNDPVNYSDPTGQMPKHVVHQTPVTKQKFGELYRLKTDLKSILNDSKTMLSNNLKEIKTNSARWQANRETLKQDNAVYGKEKMHKTNREEIEQQQREIISREVELDKINNTLREFIKADEISLQEAKTEFRKATDSLDRNTYYAWKAQFKVSIVRN